MASNIPANLARYFESPEAFKPLQAEILAAYQQGRIQRKAQEELDLLKDLSDMPLESVELFHKRKEDLMTTHGVERVYGAACDAMGQKRERSPFIPSRKDQGVVVAQPHGPLENEETFALIVKKAHWAWANKQKFTEPELSVINQVRAAGRMIKGNHSFKSAIQSCLSEAALQRAVRDAEMPPNATRQSLLEDVLKKLDRQTEIDEESDVKERLTGAPGIHARSHTAQRVQRNPAIPARLSSVASFQKIMQALLVMKFLFPGAYQAIFFTLFKQDMADALIEVALIKQFTATTHDKALEKWVLPLIENREAEASALLDEILAPQEPAPSAKPARDSFPAVLTEKPFDTLDSLREFVQLAAWVKYNCPISYESEYSEQEKGFVASLFHAWLLMEYFNYPFERAMRYVIPDFSKIDPDVVSSLVHRVSPETIDPIYAHIKTYMPFRHITIFRFMIRYIRAVQPTLQSPKAIKLAPLLLALSDRIDRSYTPFSKAIESTFNRGAFTKLCRTEKTKEMIQFIEDAMKHLMPGCPIGHKFVSNESWVNRLRDAAKKFQYAAGMPIHYCIIQQRLLLMDQAEQESDLTWDMLIYYFFNVEALRYLFDSTDDVANIQKAISAFTAIMKQV